MSNAPQGPGWWLASDGMYYPPQPMPPPPPVQKKSRVWLWVLLGVLALLGGCTVLLAGLVIAVGDGLDESRDDALEHVTCASSGVDLAGHLKIEVAVENRSDRRSDYWVTLEIRDGTDFLGSRRTNLVSIPAGERSTTELFTAIDAPPGGDTGVTCHVVDGLRTAWR